jgi:hypothetical protein
MLTNVRVIPKQSRRIQSEAAAHPDLTTGEIGARLGLSHRVVEMALRQSDRRRIKSVAK